MTTKPTFGFSACEKKELRSSPWKLAASEICFHNDGTATARLRFFWSSSSASVRMDAAIATRGYIILDSGTHDAPPRNGAPLSRSSHYWVKFAKGNPNES